MPSMETLRDALQSPVISSSVSGTKPTLSSSPESSSSSSSSSMDLARAALHVAQQVERDFDRRSTLRKDDGRASKLVALLGPDEILLSSSKGDETRNKDKDGRKKKKQPFLVTPLKGLSLGKAQSLGTTIDEDMEETRERFADRSLEGHFAVKFANPSIFAISKKEVGNSKAKKRAQQVASALLLECKILSNLNKHPHICQIYAKNARGSEAGFGQRILGENFFFVTDEINETLPDRIVAWRKKLSYEAERFDDLEQRQSEVTQRLEIALDIVSALAFLSNRKLVYLLHPTKVGFDSRMSRVKLFDFSYARESGGDPFVHFEEEEMTKRVYLAPEVLMKGEATVTVSADVYAFGMLLWEILVLKSPFQSMTKETHLEGVVQGNSRPHISKHLPQILRDLMESCWGVDEKKRPSMKEVHDRLEGLLLEGVELTVLAEEKTLTKTKSKRIAYKKDAGGNDDNRDGKSIKSHDQSIRSKGSGRSRGTRRSKETRESEENGEGEKTLRRSREAKNNLDDGQTTDDGDERRSGRSRQGTKSRRSNDAKDSSSSRSPRPSKETSLKTSNSRRRIKYERDRPSSDDDKQESKSATSGASNRSKRSTGSNESSSFRRPTSRRGTRPTEEERTMKSQRERKESFTCDVGGSGLPSPHKNREGRVRRSLSGDVPSSAKTLVAEDGRPRQPSRRKSLEGQLPSRQASTRFTSPKRVSRRLCRAQSQQVLVVHDKYVDEKTGVSPSVSNSRRSLTRSISSSSGESNETSASPPSRRIMKGRRMDAKEGIVPSGDASRQAPSRSKSNEERMFSQESLARRQQVTSGRRKSEILVTEKDLTTAHSQLGMGNESDVNGSVDDPFEVVQSSPYSSFPRGQLSRNRSSSFRKSSGAAQGRKETATRLQQQAQQLGDSDDVWAVFVAGSEKEKQKEQRQQPQQQQEHRQHKQKHESNVEVDGADARRGKLKATASGGLLQASSKDVKVGANSKAREKFMSEHHREQLEEGAVGETLREKQRRQQYSQSVAAAAAAGGVVVLGSRRDLMKSSGRNLMMKSRRSLSRESNRKLQSPSGAQATKTAA